MKEIGTNANSRKKVKKADFYEDVIIEKGSKEIKEFMAEWRGNLQKYKEVEIEKFKDLLTPLKEIVFPVKITSVWRGMARFDFDFTDAEGKKYYVIQDNKYNYKTMNTYIIGRRNSRIEPLLDRDFTFQISNDKITLIETGALKLKEDGTNSNEVVHFSYQSETNRTEVKYKSYSSSEIIKIQYPTQEAEFDKKVLDFLFQINEEKWYYYNVFPILEWMITRLGESISISIIAEIEGNVMSEIKVEKGIVQTYTQSEVINEGEIHINKIIFAKRIKEFIEKQKHSE